MALPAILACGSADETPTGPGTATLRATWEWSGHTRRRTAQATADSAGPLVLLLPDFSLP